MVLGALLALAVSIRLTGYFPTGSVGKILYRQFNGLGNLTHPCNDVDELEGS